MRIIAGLLKGRQFESPPGHRTHPMSEKMRGAIFNALGDIEGLTVWDAFAGSGAVGFEAISRGAKSALLTDVSKDAYETMRKNIRILDLEKQVKATRANASGWSDNNPKALFNIIVADPPYDDVQDAILRKLTSHLTRGGIFVVSLPIGYKLSFEKLEDVLAKDYGDSQLLFFKVK